MMNHESKPMTDMDDFDRFLSQQLTQAQPYLMDDGFAAQVMTQLSPVKKLARGQERLILVLPVLLISALVLSQFSPLAIMVGLWTWLVTLSFTGLVKTGVVFAAVAVAGACGWMIRDSRLV